MPAKQQHLSLSACHNVAQPKAIAEEPEMTAQDAVIPAFPRGSSLVRLTAWPACLIRERWRRVFAKVCKRLPQKFLARV
jgi:hypothetical protein